MTRAPFVRNWQSALAALLVVFLPAAAATAAEQTSDLQIETLELTDSSLDGVFQPGETVALQMVITNPTDRPLGRRVQLTGPGLLLDDEQWIEVPAGTAIRLERPLSGILDPTLESRSETPLSLVLGDDEQILPVWISHPLEFGGEIAVTRQPEDETSSRVHVIVHNTSRKESTAVLLARVAPGRVVEASRSLPNLPAGSSTDVIFELTGVAPELIRSGAVSLEFTAAADGRTHDRIAYIVPRHSAEVADHRPDSSATP